MIIAVTNNRIDCHFFEGTGVLDTLYYLSLDAVQRGRAQVGGEAPMPTDVPLRYLTEESDAVQYQLRVMDVDPGEVAGIGTLHPGDVLVRLVVDTRAFAPTDREIEHVNITSTDLGTGCPLTIRVVQRRSASPIPIGIAVDLGNTRSYVLVIDDLKGRRGAPPRIAPLELHDRAVAGVGAEIGVFNTILGLADPNRLPAREPPAVPRAPAAYGDAFSLLLLGRNGINVRELMAPNRDETGLAGLSSPKRYFWQTDPELDPWRMKPPPHASDRRGQPLDGALASVLADGFEPPAPPARLPRAAMVAGAIFELLERAEQQANRLDGANPAEGPRRLQAVAVSFPNTWSDQERLHYERRLRDGVHAYCRLRALPMPEVRVRCDEASSALLTYVYGEVCRFSLSRAPAWVRGIGRDALDHPYARLAVIDIGGGTSDLLVADVSTTVTAGHCKVHFQRLYRDGMNRAGDDLVRLLIERLLLPKWGPQICSDNEADWKWIVDRLFQDAAHRADRIKITQQLLVPMAVDVIVAFVNGADTIRFSIGLDEQKLLDNAVTALAASSSGRIMAKGLREAWTQMARDKQVEEAFMAACHDVFEPVGRRFGSAIAAWGCDRVVFAGKTSEIPQIQALLKDYVPYPENHFVPLKGYDVRQWNWCPGATDNKIEDAKTTTAVGAAIELLCAVQSPALTNRLQVDISSPDIGEHDTFWGVVNPPLLRFSNKRDHDCLFAAGDPDGHRAQVPFHGQPVFIGRRRFRVETLDADIAYELRLRPTARPSVPIINGCVTLARILDQATHTARLEIVDVSGCFDDLDRTRLSTAHVELRVRALATDEFWLDSGDLLSADHG